MEVVSWISVKVKIIIILEYHDNNLNISIIKIFLSMILFIVTFYNISPRASRKINHYN